MTFTTKRDTTLALFLAGMLTLLLSAPALAHNKIVRSQPADGATLGLAPTTLELQFQEATYLTGASLYAQGAGRALAILRTPAASSAFFALELPPLEPGFYRVEWRSEGDDTHRLEGVIGFRIAGERQGAPQPDSAP